MITYNLLKHEQAGEYLDFLKRLDNESEYMHYRPGERAMSVQGLQSRIKKQDNQGNSFTVLAMENKTICGYFSVNGGNSSATCHSASVAIGLLEAYRGKGIAIKLFRASEQLAYEREIFRFSCSVVAENTDAIGFYMRVGFVACGHSTVSFRTRDNRLVNELLLEYLINV